MVCPVSGSKLTLRVKKEHDGEIIDGELISTGGRHYPITRGVPRMLPVELIDDGQKETEETFSAKWKRALDFGHEDKSRSVHDQNG